MSTMTLRQRALLDQLDGASETTRGHLVALADDLGGSDPAHSLRRSTRILLRRFAEQAVTGLTFCEHLSESSPAPWWLPSEGATLRCAECVDQAVRDRAVSPPCDVCGQVSTDPLIELTVTSSLLLLHEDDHVVVPASLVAAVVCRGSCGPPQ